MRTFYILIFLISFICSLQAQTINPHYLDGRIYLKITDNESIELPQFQNGIWTGDTSRYSDLVILCNSLEIKEFIKPFKTKTKKVQSIYRLSFGKYEKINEAIRSLTILPFIEYAEKSPLYNISSMPNDTLAGLQWHLAKIQAFEAWDITTGNANIKVAIVDDACRTTHPDLADNIWINPGEIAGNNIDDDQNGFIDDVSGWDAADSDNDPNPPASLGIWGEIAFTHGTHCAGLAAGVTDNTTGIASVSHNVSLVPIKTVSNSSFIPLSIETPAEGVDYAIAAGVDVISMSFGGEDSTAFQTLSILLTTAYDQGIVNVAAAGNNGDGSGLIGTTNAINYPANFDHVIAVGATDSTDTKPGFSQYGDWIDVMSPGVSIYSTLAHSSPYGYEDGTSMACPIVAGTVALLMSADTTASPDEIEAALKCGCDNIDSLNQSFIGQMGAGRINAYKSLLCLLNSRVNQLEYGNKFFFPNPADNMLYFKSNSDFRKITIINLSGQTIKEIEMNYTQNISVADIPVGFYIVKAIDSKKTIYVQKLIIRR